MGTFNCIHSQLERLKTEGVVDFFQAAKSARIQRAGLIPDDVYDFRICFIVAKCKLGAWFIFIKTFKCIYIRMLTSPSIIVLTGSLCLLPRDCE